MLWFRNYLQGSDTLFQVFCSWFIIACLGLEVAKLKKEDMPMVYFKDGLVKKTYPKNNVKRE